MNQPKFELDIQELVKDYTDDLFRWAYYKVNHQEVAEDLVQDTFLSAVKGLHKFEGKSSAKTWLKAILNNKIVDYHRKKYKKLEINQSKISNEDDGSFMERFFDESGHWKSAKTGMWSDDVSLLDDADFQKVLQFCFEKLPEHWSLAMRLKYLEEKDGKEICQELGVSTSNYWQIIHRAKLQLRACVNSNWQN